MTGSAGRLATSSRTSSRPRAAGWSTPTNASPPPDFPVFLGRDWFGDWRARRIREMLDRSDRHTAADFATMQIDVRSAFAAEILPTLLAVEPPAGLPQQAAGLLQQLGRQRCGDGPAAAAIFNAWMQHFRDLVLARAGVPRSAAGPTQEFVSFVLSPGRRALVRRPMRTHVGAGLGGRGLSARHPASATIPPPGDGGTRIRRCSRIRSCAPSRCSVRSRPLRSPQPGDDTTVERGGLPWDGFQSVARTVLSRRIRPRGPGPQPVHRHARAVRQPVQPSRARFSAALAGRRYHHPRAAARDRHSNDQAVDAMNTPVWNAPPYD